MEIIYLFSKYSQQCKEFEKWLIISSIDYKSICIDNKSVRKIVSQDIQRVPCVFIHEEDSDIVKYEGKQAFEWIHKVMEDIRIQKEEQESIERENYHHAVSSTSPISSPFLSPVIELDEEEQERVTDHHPKNEIAPIPDKSSYPEMTHDASPSYEGMRRTIDSAPLIQQPLSKDKIEQSPLPSHSQQEESSYPENASKPESLMSLAQKLQKEREESSPST